MTLRWEPSSGPVPAWLPALPKAKPSVVWTPPSVVRPARVPTCEVTTLGFTCKLTVSNPDRFRYRWRLVTARRVSFGIWTYARDAAEISIHFESEWDFLSPDGAHLGIEVEGGKAGEVQVTRLGTCQRPFGQTLAIDAV